jgi:hypothetical protein
MISATFWLSKNCVRHPRISGGVAVLLRHLNAWLRQQGLGDCQLDELKDILKDGGLPVVEVAGTLLVPGLGLLEDLQFAKEQWRRKY